MLDFVPFMMRGIMRVGYILAGRVVFLLLVCWWMRGVGCRLLGSVGLTDGVGSSSTISGGCSIPLGDDLVFTLLVGYLDRTLVRD
jgi:hypothetical protein